jgi:hypothetical protein
VEVNLPGSPPKEDLTMAMTVTVAITNPQGMSGGRHNKETIITVDWLTETAVASGNLAALWTAANSAWQADITKIRGKILKVETAPGLNGNLTDALPTDQYDITLNDAYGNDLVDGNLMNRSGTVAESVIFDTPYPVDSEIALSVAAAGNGTKGRIIITLEN